MKTRNYRKGVLPPVRTRKGVGNYKRTAILGTPAYQDSTKRLFESWKVEAKDNREARKRDKLRQKTEREMDWHAVRMFLAKGHSLENAKLLAIDANENDFFA